MEKARKLQERLFMFKEYYTGFAHTTSKEYKKKEKYNVWLRVWLVWRLLKKEFKKVIFRVASYIKVARLAEWILVYSWGRKFVLNCGGSSDHWGN